MARRPARPVRLVAPVWLLVGLVLLAGCSSKPVNENEVREDGSPRTTPAARPTPDSTAAPTPTASPPSLRVELASLPRGLPPQVPWFDPASRTLHDAGRTVRVDLAGVVELVETRDSYVVATGREGSLTLRRLGPSGEQRVLARGVNRPLAVNAAGTLFAYSRSDQGALRVVVARTTDGRALASRSFANAPLGRYVEPVALDGGRVLLSRGDLSWWWDYGTGEETVLTHGRIGAVGVGRYAASYLDDETRWQVAGERGEDGWSLPLRWVPLAFSPTGTSLLSGRIRSFDPPGFDRGAGPLRLSAARNGSPERDYEGEFEVGRSTPPRWESVDAFLVLSRGTGRGAAVDTAWVRCWVAGVCERVSPTFRPGGGQARPWVLAQ